MLNISYIFTLHSWGDVVMVSIKSINVLSVAREHKSFQTKLKRYALESATNWKSFIARIYIYTQTILNAFLLPLQIRRLNFVHCQEESCFLIGCYRFLHTRFWLVSDSWIRHEAFMYRCTKMLLYQVWIHLILLRKWCASIYDRNSSIPKVNVIIKWVFFVFISPPQRIFDDAHEWIIIWKCYSKKWDLGCDVGKIDSLA